MHSLVILELAMVKINHSVNLKGTNRGIDKEKIARGI